MKKLIWTLAFALLCLSSCRDYRYRVEDSIYVPVVSDISILDIQENCATLSFEVRETSELGVGQCGILFSLSDFDNPKETGNNIIYIDCGRGPEFTNTNCRIFLLPKCIGFVHTPKMTGRLPIRM